MILNVSDFTGIRRRSENIVLKGMTRNPLIDFEMELRDAFDK